MSFINPNKVCPNPQQSKLEMKWYNFLIFFGIWTGALLNFLYGILYYSGIIYYKEGLSPQKVYEVFSNLKNIDQVFGVLFILLSLYQIFTGICLIKYMEIAPFLLYVMYIALGVLSLMYDLFVSAIINELSINIIGLAITGAFLIANIKYFEKREHLFINKF